VTGEVHLNRVAKGIAAGTLGGLAASLVMTGFQALMSKLDQHDQQEEPGEPANVKVAEQLSERAFNHHLAGDEKKVAGSVVHYAMGGLSGGLYGALAEMSPLVSAGRGALFGAAVWLVADEVAVPGLGLSKGPAEYPAQIHAKALASHLVYGVATDLIRRALLRVF
jgi:putative membrane protein